MNMRRPNSSGLLLRGLLPAILFLSVFCVSASELSAQEMDTLHRGATTEGREFWVVFQKNFRDYVADDKTDELRPAEPLNLELFITSSKKARGYVEVKGIGFRQDFTVNAGQVINIPVDSAAQLRTSERVEDLAVHIVSDEPIAVYGLSHRYQTTDTYLAYPVDVLGKSYRVMGYKWLADDLLSQMAVIATEDNTKVVITPSIRTQGGKPAGTPFTITLNKGQAYQVMPRFDPTREGDLTGSLIEADKPIAVFSGHNCAYVPERGWKACNILVEQIPPLQSWGRQFFVGTLAGRASSVIRVLAADDSTEVFENNRMVARLGSGQFYENPNLSQNTMLTANKPILVAQFSKGFTAPNMGSSRADSVGDPMMIIVAPTEQFLSNYRFATPVKGSWEHYINIIAPTESIGSLRLNGEPIESSRFTKFGISRYSVAQVLIDYGTYSISGNQPFGLYSYGFGYADKIFDAYGNGGGQSMIQVVESPDRLPPMVEATNDVVPRQVAGVVRDDRVNDLGIEKIEVTEFENAKVEVPTFEKGAPQVVIRIRPVFEKQNGSVRLSLTDRAGNVGVKTLCMQYDEFGDTLIVTVLDGNESCPFAPPVFLGGEFKYSVMDNHVTLPVGAELLNNPVELQGSPGTPVYGISAFGSMFWKGNISLTARVGLEFWKGDAYGYWPDSLAQRAEDGTPVLEEFQLHRSTAFLTLVPGIRYFPFNRQTYLFGNLALNIPLAVNERYTRTVLNPSNFVYESGSNQMTVYEGDGPSGFPLVIAPETGIGVTFPVRNITVFGELGAGFTLTPIAPGRDWTTTYLFGKIGGTMTFRLK